MISYQRLPGRASQQALNGISDWFGMPTWVKSYWQVVKANVAAIRATGLKISTYQQRIAIAQQTLLKRGDKFHADALNDELAKINDDLQKWWKVNGMLDDYLPQWAGLDNPDQVITSPASAVSGLGMVAPLILSAVAIGALSYVVTVGMALVQDYQFKSQLTQAVIDQKLSTGQMNEILSIPKSEGIFEKVVSTVGVGAAFGIPTALVVGGGIYLLLTTGMLNKILSGVGGMLGGSSSTSASGG